MKTEIRLSELEQQGEVESMVAELEGATENTEATPFPLVRSAAIGKMGW
ncbi:MAG: hypothetical protein ACREQQ_15160 [Candidatus Binatia bacterium]